MIIHTCKDRTPYTYLIGWTKTNMFYYGRRTAKNCHPKELFISYFTSSSYVNRYIEEYGQPDLIQIRKIFNDINSCILWEEKFLNKIDAKNNKKFLNKSNSDGKFSSTGYFPVKDIKNNIYIVSDDDPRYISGELIATSKGRKYSKEINSKKAVGLGKVAVKDDKGNNYLVSKNDPRYISGELIPVAKGLKKSKEQIGDTGKHMKGFILFKNNEGKMEKIANNHPLVLNGTIVPYGKNMPMAKDIITGIIFRTNKDDPRWKTG